MVHFILCIYIVYDRMSKSQHQAICLHERRRKYGKHVAKNQLMERNLSKVAWFQYFFFFFFCDQLGFSKRQYFLEIYINEGEI